MYIFKKIFASISIGALLATNVFSTVVYGASGLNDPEFDKSLNWMYENGLTKYNTEDAFRPFDTLTREQAAKFYSEFAMKELGLKADTSKDCSFSDMDKADSSLKDYITWGCQLGLFKGSNGMFMPTAPLTKAAALTVLVRSISGFEDENVTPWWANYFKKAKELGLTKETDVMALDRPITRYEVALILYRSSDASKMTDEEGTDEEGTDETGSEDDLGDLLSGLLGGDDEEATDEEATDEEATDGEATDGEATDEEATDEEATDEEATDEEATDEEATDEETTSDLEGDVLEVTVSPSTPQYKRLPKGADGVVAAVFDFTAGESDVEISSITLKRIGDGADNGVSNAAIYDSKSRISKTKSFNSSDDTATLFFSPKYVVKAGETVPLKVVVSVGTTAGSQFAIQLTDVAGGAEISSDLPVTANIMEVGTTTATKLQLQSTGSISDPKIGVDDSKIANFKLKNNSSENESVLLKQITFEEEGSIDEEEDIENFKLWVDGKVVSEVAKSTGKQITFDIKDGITIKEGNSKSFDITAKLVGGAQRTLVLEIDKPLDVVAEGSKYGNIDVDIADTTTISSLSIEAGELTLISIDPTSTEVRRDKDDVILGKIKVVSNAGKQLELQKFTTVISVIATGGSLGLADMLENVELYDETNGIVYDLSCTGGAATGTTSLTCSDTSLNVRLPETGDLTFAIRSDIKDVDIGSYIFRASVTPSSSNGFYVEETQDDTQVTDITPSNITFKNIEGTSSSATFSVLSLSASKNAVIGSKGLSAFEFEIKADESSDLTIDEIKVSKVSGSGTFNNGLVNEVKLYQTSIDDTNLLDRVSGSQVANEIATFDGFSVNIPKNEKKKFIVTVSFVDDITNVSKTLKLGLALTGNISIEDEDNDDVYVSSTGASARVFTIVGAGSLAVVEDNTDSENRLAKNIVGNTTSPFVASFELTATNEPIKIKDLTFVATGDTSNFANSIDEVIIYANDKTTEIDRESVSSTTVTFDNINYVVKEGSENFYIKVVTAKIGKDQPGVQSSDFYLKLNVTDAEGDESGKTISGLPLSTNNSLGFKVLPTRVSNVTFVNSDSAKSTTLASKLNNGSNNAAILAITTDSSSNSDSDGGSLKTILKQIKLDVTYFASGSISNMTIQKVNGSTGSIAGTLNLSNGSGTVTFVMTGLSSDGELDNGTTTYFVVKADYTKNATADNDDYVKVEFNSLNNGEVKYTSDHQTYSGTSYNIDDLRIGVTTIDGIQLNE